MENRKREKELLHVNVLILLFFFTWSRCMGSPGRSDSMINRILQAKQQSVS